MVDVTLLPLSDFDPAMLEFISGGVEKELGCRVYSGIVNVELGKYFDPSRRQYNADELLKHVYESRNLFPRTKVLALFDVDLFIPILTYIFGQAFLNGDAGLASSYRLKNERYGMPRNDVLYRERFLKEVLHELGHTYGLKHCFHPECVMRSSTYVEDIDQKNAAFCADCRIEAGFLG